MYQVHPQLHRLILFGTPLLTGIQLLFHPRPVPPEVAPGPQVGGMDVFALLGPVANPFLVVHVLFAPALALLGLSVVLLLDDEHGLTANISRMSAFVFVVTYIMYETIVGTVPALLVRGAAGLSPNGQAVISDAVNRILGDPILGDPSVLYGIASLSWPLAVISAAFALRRSGKPRVPCILLGLSFIFTFHASPLGSAGMLLLLLAAVAIERDRSRVLRKGGLRDYANLVVD